MEELENVLAEENLLTIYDKLFNALTSNSKSEARIVDSKVIGSIANGLLCLIGICHNDDEKDKEFIVRKILNMRIFYNDKRGKNWDVSVVDMDYEVLCISQFTLHSTYSGNTLDFHKAMKAADAKEMYIDLLRRLAGAYHPSKVKDGIFGAMMDVELVNDGPVTLLFDSQNRNKN